MPDPIDTQDLRATPFGITCIGVDWTDPDNIEIRGPPADLSFFVTINGSSSDPLTVNVGERNATLLHDYTAVKPGDTYDIEVNTHVPCIQHIHACYIYVYCKALVKAIHIIIPVNAFSIPVLIV